MEVQLSLPFPKKWQENIFSFGQMIEILKELIGSIALSKIATPGARKDALPERSPLLLLNVAG
eukprot:344710-Amphidinium_carterae.1